MNDIEKMKVEYEQKIKWAEMENELSKKLPKGVRISIIGNSLTQKGKLHTLISSEDWSRGLTEQQVGELMLAFPVTEKSRTYVGNDQYSEKDYEMQTHRYVHVHYTELRISWISGELDISVDVRLDYCSEEIRQFFIYDRRRLNCDELRYGDKPETYLQFYTFAYGHVVRFSGGYHKQVSDFALNDIVVKFKYLAEFNQE